MKSESGEGGKTSEIERGRRKRAREGREWERSKLYMYIIVHYSYTFVYRASEIGRGRREA